MYKLESIYYDVSNNLAFLPVNTSSYMFEISQNPTNGTAAITNDGLVRYMGDFNFCGVDRLEYTVTDLQTGEQYTAATTVHVMEDIMRCDDHITVAGNDFGYMYEDGSYSGNVSENDFQGMMLPFDVNQSLVTNPNNGSVSINPDGTYTYTPNPGFFGSDRFSYEICYRSADEVDFPYEVESTNVPVTMSSGQAQSEHLINMTETGEITSLSISNLFIDHDNLGDISVRLISPSGKSAVLFQNVCEGYQNMRLNFSDQASQTILPCPATNDGFYKPKASFSKFIGEQVSGDWKLVITDLRTQSNVTTLINWEIETVINGNAPLDCRVANVEMLVMPNAEAPVANEDCIEVIDPTQVQILDVLLNDTDHNNDIDPSSLRLTSFPTYGAASVLSNGDLYFKAHDDFEGIQTFEYEICDSLGLCSRASIKIMVGSSLAIDFYELELSKTSENMPRLDWRVNEDHTAYNFEIERSTTGDRFESIAHVIADQNQHLYNYTDETFRASQGRVYYRIKAIDLDGTEKYTDIVSLELNTRSEVAVYPNPFADRLTVTLDTDQEEEIAIELYSVGGQLIATRTFFGQSYTLEVGTLDLPAGEYHYRVLAEELLDSGLLIKR